MAVSPVADVTRGLVIKESLKGLIGIPVAISACFLMSWSSQWNGFPYWAGTVSGLVIFCIALAYIRLAFPYFVVGIKLLTRWGAGTADAASVKVTGMKEWMKVFLAFASIGAGICFIVRAYEISYYLAEWMPYCIGVILIAAGITYFWTHSKFYKG